LGLYVKNFNLIKPSMCKKTGFDLTDSASSGNDFFPKGLFDIFFSKV